MCIWDPEEDDRTLFAFDVFVIGAVFIELYSHVGRYILVALRFWESRRGNENG